MLAGEEAEDDGRRRHLFGFGGLALMTMLLIAITWNVLNAGRTREAAERGYLHTLNILLVTGELRDAVQVAIRGERVYLLTHQPAYFEMFGTGTHDATARVAQLDRITADNLAQRRNVSALKKMLRSYFAMLGRCVAFARAGAMQEATAPLRLDTDRRQVVTLLAQLDRVEIEEKRRLVQRAHANAEATRRTDAWTISLCAMGFASMLASIVAARSTLAARNRMIALTRQLRISATTDELTGLTNRRSFLEQTDSALALAHRASMPLSIAVLDIDHFKRINDAHGHQTGDAVLRAVAGILRETARLSDVVGRIGGEEFAVLMPDTDAEQAQAACERLRRALANHVFELPEAGEVRVTFSAGVAVLLRGEAPDCLMSRADNALYRAKADGRNRVLLAA